MGTSARQAAELPLHQHAATPARQPAAKRLQIHSAPPHHKRPRRATHATPISSLTSSAAAELRQGQEGAAAAEVAGVQCRHQAVARGPQVGASMAAGGASGSAVQAGPQGQVGLLG